MQIIVSSHAIDRLKQRFGLKFYRYTSDRTMMRNLKIVETRSAEMQERKVVGGFVQSVASSIPR